MKIQCSCGAKYLLDVTPGMPPVHFVCSSCGQDYSAFINDMIRKELGEPAPPPPPPPMPAAPEAPAAPAAPEGSRLKISRGHAPAAPAQEAAPVSKYCERHKTERTTANCQACNKPICPKCMQTFGDYCSAFCRNKIEDHSKTAPAFGGDRYMAEHRFWRKVGTISAVLGVLLVAGLGFWIWYAWIASVPSKYFSVSYDTISHSGTSRIVGADQLVFLHGGTLARYNLQTKQKLWSVELISPEQVDEVVKAENDERAHRDTEPGEIVLPNYIQKYARIGLEQQISLQGAQKNIWTANGNTLTHYDWDTGNILQQVVVTNGLEELAVQNDEFLIVGRAADGAQAVTHINMDDGTMQTEEFSDSNANVVAESVPQAASQDGGGLPLSPNGNNGPMNPQRVAQDAQNLSYPARLALPALLGNSMHERQINDELADEDGRNRTQQSARAAQPQQLVKVQDFSLVPDGDSYVAFGSKMIQKNFVPRDAMKADSGTSALNSPDLSAANETEAVNQQLNEIQRNNGGGNVMEDQSRYQVALRRPISLQPDWTGEVIGPPQLFALATVNVLVAGKTIIAFDKSNKQLWQAQASYPVTGGDMQTQGQSLQSEYGAGPCVEHDGTLYVFDQAVLTAYDPTSGSVRWRIPSVGVVGLFFDDQGMLYVNTTTGNPDDIKYSRQIDITKQTSAVVMKVNPANGATLWSTDPGGYISYLSGKFLYADQYFDPGDEEDQMSDAMSGLEKPPYFRIIRINPANGRTEWFYNEAVAPVDIQFNRNQISIVLKQGIEVLRFFTF